FTKTLRDACARFARTEAFELCGVNACAVLDAFNRLMIVAVKCNFDVALLSTQVINQALVKRDVFGNDSGDNRHSLSLRVLYHLYRCGVAGIILHIVDTKDDHLPARVWCLWCAGAETFSYDSVVIVSARDGNIEKPA